MPIMRLRRTDRPTTRALALGAALALAVAGTALAQSAPDAGKPDAAKPAAPQNPGVPVTTVRAEAKDFPVYLRGLGTVQAFYAVTVKARVDGTLTQVPVTEGQEVHKGDLIATIDPRPYQAALDQAMAKKAQDEAQLSNAQTDLGRYTSLARQDFASRQQVDTQKASVMQSTAALKGDDAMIAAAQLNLSFCAITSPIDGRVGLRQVDPGNLIHANDANGILTITQFRPITVVFTLPQQTLPGIVDAMAAGKPPVVAYSGDDREVLGRGALLTPDNTIDPATGTIRLKAVFGNENNKLWPGQFVNARLLVQTIKGAVTIPSAAVQHGPDGLFTYVIKPDRTAAKQEIDVTQDDGTTAVVAKGVSVGTEVVVAGQSRLQAGMKVAANPGAGAGASGAVPTSTDPAKAGG
jgi:multidrug efflux system membrane fusion protein